MCFVKFVLQYIHLINKIIQYTIHKWHLNLLDSSSRNTVLAMIHDHAVQLAW